MSQSKLLAVYRDWGVFDIPFGAEDLDFAPGMKKVRDDLYCKCGASFSPFALIRTRGLCPLCQTDWAEVLKKTSQL